MTDIRTGPSHSFGSSNYYAQFKVVAVDPNTEAFLHLSGTGETYERSYAWVGSRRQFDRLKPSLDKKYNLVPIVANNGTPTNEASL